LHEATTDANKIRSWWSRWPEANIGVATGTSCGIVVVDLDLPKAEDSLDRLDQLELHLSPTLTAQTGGGRHLYFAGSEKLSNTTGRLPGIDESLPGIDLRADGGYVVAPPSLHVTGVRYTWVDPGTQLARLPEWITAPERLPSPTVSMASAPTFDGDGTPYGLAALEKEIDLLARTAEGARNDQLNRSAFALGQLIAGGEIAEVPARAALEQIGFHIGLDEREVSATIESGLRAGRLEPRRRPVG
jgi:putative DNA primase/helicase